MRDARLGFQYCIQNKGCHCSPQEGVEGGAPLPGDFRLIVCLTPPQMNDFGDLLGTPYAPVSKIAPVKWRILSQTGKIGSGKNTKFLFFLLGLKYTLRTCFESTNFSSNSCPELSNQVLSFSEGQIYQQFTKVGRPRQFKFFTSGGQVWT